VRSVEEGGWRAEEEALSDLIPDFTYLLLYFHRFQIQRRRFAGSREETSIE
jgi:hypothetical protein